MNLSTLFRSERIFNPFGWLMVLQSMQHQQNQITSWIVPLYPCNGFYLGRRHSQCVVVSAGTNWSNEFLGQSPYGRKPFSAIRMPFYAFYCRYSVGMRACIGQQPFKFYYSLYLSISCSCSWSNTVISRTLTFTRNASIWT